MVSYASDTATTTQTAAEKPTSSRLSEPAPAPSMIDAEKPTLPRSSSVDPTVLTSSGIIIPGVFRSVDVRVVDTEGSVREDVIFLLTLDLLPTGGRITDGYGKLPLLKASYQRFMAVARSPESDLAWYSAEASDPITPSDDQATIIVEPTEISGSGGLSIGGGR